MYGKQWYGYSVSRKVACWTICLESWLYSPIRGRTYSGRQNKWSKSELQSLGQCFHGMNKRELWKGLQFYLPQKENAFSIQSPAKLMRRKTRNGQESVRSFIKTSACFFTYWFFQKCKFADNFVFSVCALQSAVAISLFDGAKTPTNYAVFGKV